MAGSHLAEAYKGKLYVVLYAVKGAGLVREGVVSYWIEEDGKFEAMRRALRKIGLQARIGLYGDMLQAAGVPGADFALSRIRE